METGKLVGRPLSSPGEKEWCLHLDGRERRGACCALLSSLGKVCAGGESGFASRCGRCGVPVRPRGDVHMATGNESGVHCVNVEFYTPVNKTDPVSLAQRP